MRTIPRCVNHPDIETRISCSSCGDPICTRCMRQAAVGQKCPRCARPPRRARGLGKPKHYVKGVLAGLAVAVVGGLIAHELLRVLPFGGFILPGLLGFAVGRAVGWGAAGQSQQPFTWIATALGAAAGLVAVAGPLLVLAPLAALGPFTVLACAIAGFFALRGIRG